jgi:hypothetical protein
MCLDKTEARGEDSDSALAGEKNGTNAFPIDGPGGATIVTSSGARTLVHIWCIM